MQPEAANAEVQERTVRSYYLLNICGVRASVAATPNVEGAEVVGEPVQAESYAAAVRLFAERAKQLQAEIAAQIASAKSLIEVEAPSIMPPASILKQEPVFRSAHEAMTFAFRFAGQHSPKTPMSVLMQPGGLGSGRGLTGVDGSGQAGMVLAALRHLDDEKRNVIVARYGDTRTACPCCGQPAPDRAWVEAVDALSLCDELQDLPKPVRHAAIEKSVCRRKLRFGTFVTEYGLSERTLRDKTRKVKERLGRVENAALAWLGDHFSGRGLLVQR